MLSLGIDQSLTSSGYCLVAYDESLVLPYVIDHGIVTSSKDETRLHDLFYRIMEIEDFFIDYVREHNVEQIQIEGISFGSRGDATRNLAALQGVLITGLLRSCDCVIKIVAPPTLKKYATNNGFAKKDLLLESLPEDIKTEFTSKYKKSKGLSDVVDAYWLACYK